MLIQLRHRFSMLGLTRTQKAYREAVFQLEQMNARMTKNPALAGHAKIPEVLALLPFFHLSVKTPLLRSIATANDMAALAKEIE